MIFRIKNKIIITKILVVCSVVLLLSGCTSMLILGTGVATGGYIAGRDKHINQSIGDTRIDSKIKTLLSQNLGELALDISVVTDNGCVLLVGNAPNQDVIDTAERLAWQVKGVQTVDNNITIGKSKVSTILKDSYITSTCRAKLLANKDIKSLNIKIKTMSHIVYLNGTARSQRELDKIIDIIKSTNGVEKVVSYISLVGDTK